jgi:hypothetical protein
MILIANNLKPLHYFLLDKKFKARMIVFNIYLFGYQELILNSRKSGTKDYIYQLKNIFNEFYLFCFSTYHLFQENRKTKR